MTKRLLMGNEAFAYAALESGIALAAGCPGYPATEVIETCAKLLNKGRSNGLHVEWSSDEATALGICAAASMSGLRSLFSCKSAGLNVASDVLMSLSYTGIRGGLVMCIADDPGATSSAVEQDTRMFAAFSKIPVLDPATPEQGFIMMKRAFELSEATQRPVILRTTTRICLTSTFFNVDDRFRALSPRTPSANFKSYNTEAVDVKAIDGFVHDPKRWSIYPYHAEKAESVIANSLSKISHTYTYDPIFAAFNPLYLNGQLMETAFEEIQSPATVGIVASGDSATCVLEALEMFTRSIRHASLKMPEYRFIQIGTPYPFPHRTLTRFFKDLKHVLVIEQLSSFIEEELLKLAGTRFLAPTIHGKATNEAQRFGELTIEDTLYRIARFFDEYATSEKKSDGHSGLIESENTDPKDTRTRRSNASSESAIAGRLAVLQKHTSYTDIVDHMAGPGAFYSYNKNLPPRNPVLCAGCPHRGSMFAVKEALSHLGIPRLDAIFSGDMGCQLLGSAEPLDMIDASLCLGASSAMSQGFAAVNAQKKSIAFIGDSSFISSSLPTVANAAHNMHDVTFLILDNNINALDGLQPDSCSQNNITKAKTPKVEIVNLLRSLGIQAVHKADPLNRIHAEDACVKAIQFKGPSAVVFESPCALLFKSDKVALVNIFKCTGCKKCILELGCPAIKYDPDAKGPKSGRRGQALIDPEQCNGCGLCTQVCAYQAIKIFRRNAVPSFEPTQRLDPKESLLNTALKLDIETNIEINTESLAVSDKVSGISGFNTDLAANNTSDFAADSTSGVVNFDFSVSDSSNPNGSNLDAGDTGFRGTSFGDAASNDADSDSSNSDDFEHNDANADSSKYNDTNVNDANLNDTNADGSHSKESDFDRANSAEDNPDKINFRGAESSGEFNDNNMNDKTKISHNNHGKVLAKKQRAMNSGEFTQLGLFGGELRITLDGGDD